MAQIAIIPPLGEGRPGGVREKSTKILFNRRSRKQLRKKLRNEMPLPERLLWAVLRGKQLKGYRWRRQYGIGPYIVDFYCPGLQIVIEVDGDSHFDPEAEEYDKHRSKYITGRHIKILRFTNLDVTESIEGVYEKILENLP